MTKRAKLKGQIFLRWDQSQFAKKKQIKFEKVMHEI